MNPIVGIGELLWDIFPDGRKVAGGAPFNFAFHCKQLGHDAVIVSRVGADELGRELRDEVRRLGLSDEFIQTDYDHPTGTVRVTVDERGQPAYTIAEDVAWDYIEWDWTLNAMATDCRAVCFGTLAQRAACSATTIHSFVRQSCGQVRVFDVNLRDPLPSRRIVLASLSVAIWVKLNLLETDELAVILEMYPEEIVPAHRMDVPHSIWIVTDGADGVVIYTPTGSFHEPGVPARVIDTVGAGDAFTAAMVCLHLEGRPLRECARFANHYAARVCEHQGATPRIDRAEVERAAFG